MVKKAQMATDDIMSQIEKHRGHHVSDWETQGTSCLRLRNTEDIMSQTGKHRGHHVSDRETQVTSCLRLGNTELSMGV